ncbi:hypothetical protein BOX15_Mlig034405g3 [Macrostomum lignano]|uniref:Uncharacterized protein n=1 Tax=Macrostomum lignano TaxID=282301 RepID=A0A267EAL7_9PLAT|nr:hypothetical protein BOX15_Mlig034405g3 [Macrostomum lignano]
MAENGDLKSARVIFIMGGPGSGKATQCERLVSTYGLTHLSTGELLRTEIALGAGSAYRLRRTMLNNDLVPVADVLRLLGNAMRARLLDSPGFLINGCPKDREQAMAFEMMLVPCRVVVFLDVPEDVMWQRLMRRGRRTDQEEVIQKKIKTFREKTLSVVKYFERQGKLVRVDGTGTVSEVFSRVRDGLMNFRPKTASKQPANAARGKMSSRVMAFKAAVARHPADGKAHRAAKDAEIKSNKTSDSIPSSPTKGVKAGSTDSSSPSHKHKKKQANPGQKHQKHHGHQSQQKSDRDAAKHRDQPSPRHRQGKKEHEPAAKQQTPEKQHHQAAKQQTPEKQHHQAAKQKTPQKQHHQAAKQQTPEKHHQTAKPNAFDKNHQSKKADQQKI